MTAKRFTNMEHDYENAWIKCNDDGDFMIYAIYKELDESLPSLEDLLNGLHEENQSLKKQNKRLEEKIQRERTSFIKTHERWSKEAETKIKELAEENEQLKKENTKIKTKINRELNKAMEILDGKRDLPPRTSIDYWVGINNILFNLKEDFE